MITPGALGVRTISCNSFLASIGAQLDNLTQRLGAYSFLQLLAIVPGCVELTLPHFHFQAASLDLSITARQS